MKKFVVLSLFLVLILNVAGCSFLTPKGSISGTIMDVYTQEPVADVTIQVGGRTATTTAEGTYSITEIKAGSHDLSATANGYITYEQSVVIEENKNTVVNFTMEQSEGIITGYVTDGRGGPAVEEAIVSFNNGFVVTDTSGYFELPLPAGFEGDVLVSKEGRGTTRVQGLNLMGGQILDFEIPTRPDFSPNWSHNAPVINVNVDPGDVLTGTVNIEVAVDAEEDVYVYYLYLGGEQRYPNDGFDVESTNGSFEIDTTLFPNGDSYLRLLAYDRNGNAALYILPVTIENAQNDTALPVDILTLELESYTFGTNIVFYGDNPISKLANEAGIKLHDTPIDADSAPEGATLFNRVYWSVNDDDTYNIDGFSVYRSFDGINYKLIGNIHHTSTDGYSIYGRYDDWSPELAPNKKTYYRVVPYNSFGVGNPIERDITPLPAHNVVLQTPANGATDVPLNPTFTWTQVWSEEPDTDVEMESVAIIDIWDATDYRIYSGYSETNEFTYPSQLAPGGIYSWDISANVVFALYSDDEYGYAMAQSISGEYTSDMWGSGSINGEFVFTTTTVYN